MLQIMWPTEILKTRRTNFQLNRRSGRRNAGQFVEPINVADTIHSDFIVSFDIIHQHTSMWDIRHYLTQLPDNETLPKQHLLYIQQLTIQKSRGTAIGFAFIITDSEPLHDKANSIETEKSEILPSLNSDLQTLTDQDHYKGERELVQTTQKQPVVIRI